jgi:hypothetical protein
VPKLDPVSAPEPASTPQSPARRSSASALYPMPTIPDDPGPDPAETAPPQRRFFS